MSTQRRADRRVADCMKRRVGNPELRSAFRARFAHLQFAGTTAPLMSIFWLAWAWFFALAAMSRRRGSRRLFLSDEASQTTMLRAATKSLHSDHCFETLAASISRRSLPPRGGAANIARPITRANRRSSLPHIPILSVHARLRHTLPYAPVARLSGRWAERHDGKRDLYFQHAA